MVSLLLVVPLFGLLAVLLMPHVVVVAATVLWVVIVVVVVVVVVDRFKIALSYDLEQTALACDST